MFTGAETLVFPKSAFIIESRELSLCADPILEGEWAWMTRSPKIFLALVSQTDLRSYIYC